MHRVSPINTDQTNSINAPQKTTEDSKESLLPQTIRSEVNFLVLPFFALWDKDVNRRTKTEYKIATKRGNERIEIAWTVNSNPAFGYPGPFDRSVHKAIEQIIGELPLPIQNPIPLGSLYNLCKRMGIKKLGGAQYRRIKKAFERIATTSIKSEGAFYSKEKEEWAEDIFHLYDRVIFMGKKLPSGETADTNYLYLNSWYLDNINARYVKPIDWNYYASLQTPITQRLYELLGVKFYGVVMRRGRYLSYKYSTLCDLLPITRQKHLSFAKRILDPAHKRLKETRFLADWDWEELPRKGNGNDWLIKYHPGERAKEEIKRFGIGEQMELELPSPRGNEIVEDKPGLSADESPMLKQLVERGITNSTARKLAKEHPIEQIQNQIEVFDWLKETRSHLVEKNPAGFLRKAIEENYEPPKEYHDNLKRDALEQKARDRRERWIQHREDQISRDIANWDKTPPEERVKGMLEFWIAGQKMNMIHPTPEEIEARKHELIDNLPDNHEGKREYISRNYPESPPDNFE